MKGLLFLRREPLSAAVIICLFAVGFIGLPYEGIGALLAGGAAAPIAGMAVCRAAALAAMLVLSAQLALPRAPQGAYPARTVLFALPALAVAVNNAPLIALFTGSAQVEASASLVALFAVQCAFVAAFEETAFRAVIFPLMLQRFGTEVRGRMCAALCSSALFGLAHLLNLFSGSGAGAVILQTGYSFLIGAMLCAVLFLTGRAWLCSVLHAVYNFGGLLVPTLGTGAFFDLWNVPTIVLTVLIALAAAAFYVRAMLRADAARGRALFWLSPHDLFALRRRRTL